MSGRIRCPSHAYPLGPQEVQAWFGEALPKSFRARPSVNECDRIAVATRNRLLVARDADRPLAQQAGRTAGELIAIQSIEAVKIAAALHQKLEELDALGGISPADHDTGEFPFTELHALLARFPFVELRTMLDGHTPPPGSMDAIRRPGRPASEWRPAALAFAKEVRRALHDLGYDGDTNPTNKNGVIAAMGGLFIAHAVEGIKGDVAAATFAERVRNTRPSRAKIDRFPWAPQPNG